MPFYTPPVCYSWEVIIPKQITHQREANYCSALIQKLSLWPHINAFKKIHVCLQWLCIRVCKRRWVWACLQEAALNNSLLILQNQDKNPLPCLTRTGSSKNTLSSLILSSLSNQIHWICHCFPQLPVVCLGLKMGNVRIWKLMDEVQELTVDKLQEQYIMSDG